MSSVRTASGSYKMVVFLPTVSFSFHSAHSETTAKVQARTCDTIIHTDDTFLLSSQSFTGETNFDKSQTQLGNR